MYSYIFRIIFTVFLLNIITSCSSDTNNILSSSNTVGSGAQKIEKSNIKNSITESTVSNSISSNDSFYIAPRATDKKSMENIMNNPGLTQCEKITDLQLKEKCTDNLFYSKATLAKNSILCNEIKDKKIIGACIVNSINVSLSEKNNNPCVMDDMEIRKSCTESLIIQQAMVAMDPNLCIKITDSVEQKNCKTTITMTKAIKNTDAKICMELDDFDQQKNCKDIFNQQSSVNMMFNQ